MRFAIGICDFIFEISSFGLVVQWIVRKSPELDIPVRFWARLQINKQGVIPCLFIFHSDQI